MKKLNKKYNILIDNNWETICGTTNKDDPKVIFLSCKTRVNINNNINFNESLNIIFKNLKFNIKNFLRTSKLFDTKFILDYDFAEIASNNHQQILTFDIFLKQKQNLKTLKNLIFDIEKDFKPILNNFTNFFIQNEVSITKTKQ